MKIFFALLMLAVLSPIANAQSVVNLSCTGSTPDGKTKTIKFDFSPDQGWVEYGFRITGAVTATHINSVFFGVNRETGEFWYRGDDGGPNYKGTCKKNETKF